MVSVGDIEERQERNAEREDDCWNRDEMGLVPDPMAKNPQNEEGNQRQ